MIDTAQLAAYRNDGSHSSVVRQLVKQDDPSGRDLIRRQLYDSICHI